jgi:hypothetical protein
MNAIMAIPEADLEEFIGIYEQICGEHLSREEARPIATQLVDLFRLLTQPLPDEPGPLVQTGREAAGWTTGAQPIADRPQCP